MNEPRECSYCDCPISDDAQVCSCCGNVVDGSKLDQEIDEAIYKDIQEKLDLLEV